MTPAVTGERLDVARDLLAFTMARMRGDTPQAIHATGIGVHIKERPATVVNAAGQLLSGLIYTLARETGQDPYELARQCALSVTRDDGGPTWNDGATSIL